MSPVRRHTLPALAAGIAVALAAPTAAARVAEQAAGAAPQPYRDRIIAPERLAPLPPDDEEDPDTAGGLPRAWWLELGASRSRYGDQDYNEHGLAAGGFWETAAHGSLSLDASVFRSDRARFGDARGGDAPDLRGSATLWQRDLALDGGWRGDNGLGVLNTPMLPLQRSQYRFLLPSVPFAGASSEWRDDARGLRLHGAFGRAGNFSGARLVGFDLADGHVAGLGAQWAWAPQWTGAAAFLATDGRIVPDAQGGAAIEPADTRAVHAATAWQGAYDAAQLNLLSSDGDRGVAHGAWLDARAQRGRYVHHYGAFRLQPDLAWGALPIANDAQGGYYRVAYQYGRWLWNGGVDLIRSLSGEGFDGEYFTGYARHQASSTHGYGAGLNLRNSDSGVAHNAQLFADRRTRWGDTRMQLDHARDDGGDSWQASLDQGWPLQQGARLSTSIALGELAYEGEDPTRTLTLAAYGARDLGDRFSVDGNLRWTHADGPYAARGFNLNLGLQWRISQRWSLLTSFYQSQGVRRSPFVLDPLVPDTGFTSLPRDRSVFLSLRYARRAGRPQAVLGGAPGAAAGAIAGTLYLDENGDGQRAASELPAANITIVLDGRYSVRTDARGAFGFPRVAAGAHVLTVLPDNLPLPWSVDEAARSVQVRVRTQSSVDIGATRPR